MSRTASRTVRRMLEDAEQSNGSIGCSTEEFNPNAQAPGAGAEQAERERCSARSVPTAIQSSREPSGVVIDQTARAADIGHWYCSR